MNERAKVAVSGQTPGRPREILDIEWDGRVLGLDGTRIASAGLVKLCDARDGALLRVKVDVRGVVDFEVIQPAGALPAVAPASVG